MVNGDVQLGADINSICNLKSWLKVCLMSN